MTFKTNNVSYRVAFDTKNNIFMVYDANDHNKVAYGITIKQAVRQLKETA
ncbi:hypothetical protein I6N96_04200 [Enterococcus sp. BWM-S5]|uniref:Uncharacterized protein n=2 Tax=Enterococcus TaxID=1350 RepID=A0AAQ3VQE4_9ENTE|nr:MULTISPECIES: hypothetical protein [Enterococcus]MBL1226975.1 hypothetical protein [Enterococcus sp. BWR-S5]MBP1045466.1 hypothetical protein [Enterococcus larvae]